MELDEITLRLIQEFNEHWRTGKIREKLKERFRRRRFYDIVNYLDERQIISITGLRRVGKTTVMYQLMDYLINKEINPKNIFYFSFDEITTKKTEIIDELIRYFISKNGIEKDGVFIFFDEIQKINDWQAIIKRYYDLKENIKFIVSGSESLILKGETKESLAGRNYEFVMHPLSFREFLEFKGIEIKKENIKELYEELITEKEKFQSLFHEFIISGGFPEMIGKDIEKIQGYIKGSIIEKIIYYDLPKEFRIDNPELLLKILEIASANTGQLFELEKITSSLGISRNTASLYLSYLENAFLINFSYNYTKSKIKQIRTRKKIYVCDNGIINTILKQREVPNDFIGLLAETQIHNEISRKMNTFFWRDKQKREVDIITENHVITPIEVKYRNEIEKRDKENIKYFMKKYRLTTGFLVTKNIFNYHEDLKLVPAWLFLLTETNK